MPAEEGVAGEGVVVDVEGAGVVAVDAAEEEEEDVVVDVDSYQIAVTFPDKSGALFVCLPPPDTWAPQEATSGSISAQEGVVSMKCDWLARISLSLHPIHTWSETFGCFV